MELTITGRKGALTTYRVNNIADMAAAEALVESATTYPYRTDGDTITGSTNKSELRTLMSAVERAATAPAKTTTDTRRIELFATAERMGLNHGRAWFCTGYNVDVHSLPPEWEGEAVCYVYS